MTEPKSLKAEVEALFDAAMEAWPGGDQDTLLVPIDDPARMTGLVQFMLGFERACRNASEMIAGVLDGLDGIHEDDSKPTG